MSHCVFMFCGDTATVYVNRTCVNGHDRSNPACDVHRVILEDNAPGWLCYTCHDELAADVPADYVSTVEIADA